MREYYIKITNLMTWDKLEISVPLLTLIAGENSSGKSSILYAIASILQSINQGLSAEEVMRSYWYVRDVNEIIRYGSSKAVIEMGEKGEEPFLVAEVVDGLVNIEGEIERAPDCIIIPVNAASKIKETYSLDIAAPDWLNIVSNYFTSEIDLSWNEEVVNTLDEELKEVSWEAPRLTTREGRLEEIGFLGKKFSVGAASTGLLNLALITWVLMASKPGMILLLEEIEGSMHPSLHYYVTRGLVKLAYRRGCNIVISTQSEHVINAVSSLIVDKDIDTRRVVVYYTSLDKEDHLSRIEEAGISDKHGIERLPDQLVELEWFDLVKRYGELV